MVNKWLHIDESVGDPWVLPIYSALNTAVQNGRAKVLPPQTRELGFALSTRLNILPRVFSRINDEVATLYQECKSHGPEHVFQTKKDGYAFRVTEDLTYHILIDIDSLLFELNSCCELINKFFQALYNHSGNNITDQQVGPRIREIVTQAGQNPSWFIKLDSHRNFLIHEGAPYIAVDLSNGPNNYDLLIMKENIYEFVDKDKFFSLSELNDIVQGFLRAKPVIQTDLKNLF